MVALIFFFCMIALFSEGHVCVADHCISSVFPPQGLGTREKLRTPGSWGMMVQRDEDSIGADLEGLRKMGENTKRIL